MTYPDFDKALPNELTEDGPQALDSIRKNFRALRDFDFFGGSTGWSYFLAGSADEPTTMLWQNGAERIRLTATWGTTGGANGNISSVTIAYSSDSGATFDTIETRNASYDADGNFIGGAHTLLLPILQGLPGRIKTLTARVADLESGGSVIDDDAASTTTAYSSTKTDDRYLQKTGGTLTGAVTFSANAAIKTATHTVVTPAALAIDWTASHRQSKSVSTSPTFTFVAPAGPANLLVKVSNTHGSASITPVWPAGVKWATTPPALAAGKTALYMLYYDGSVYWGSYLTGYTT